MRRKFLRSLLFLFGSVFAAASLSFFLIHLIPGDPADFILKDRGNLEEKQLLRESLGLNKPLLRQYADFLQNLTVLDLGRSLLTEEPVFDTLLEQSAFTARLALPSLFLAFFFGVFLGVFSFSLSNNRRRGVFSRRRKRFSAAARFFDILPVALFSAPAFVLAPLLTGFFSLFLKQLPVSGAGSLRHLILPSVSLAVPLSAVLMKITRAALSEAARGDFVRTAQAKGLSAAQIRYKHILSNAAVPVLTAAGLQAGALLTGTVIIEALFDRPGIGSLLFRSILNRDYPVIQGAVLFIALVYVLINRLTDLLSGLINPLFREAS